MIVSGKKNTSYYKSAGCKDDTTGICRKRNERWTVRGSHAHFCMLYTCKTDQYNRDKPQTTGYGMLLFFAVGYFMKYIKEGHNLPSSVNQTALVHNHHKAGNKRYTQENKLDFRMSKCILVKLSLISSDKCFEFVDTNAVFLDEMIIDVTSRRHY